MLIALVTDAWHPQVNGVVRTWTTMLKILRDWGHEVIVISPEGSRTVPAPSEPELRLCIQPRRQLKRLLGDVVPDALHIATEGPLGLAARRMALRRGWRFTTSFHTMFPDYLEARMGIPAWLPWRFMQWFHKPSQRVLVPTPTVRDTVARHGLKNLRVWSRGVDAQRFQPVARDAAAAAAGLAALGASTANATATSQARADADGIYAGLPRPVFLSVGRVAREKNLDAFLSLDLPGSKVVVGGGPDEERLRRKYPGVRFTGMQADDVLPNYYAAADVFVFPSLTDTFGLVMLEAMACGTPVAAFHTDAPLAVIEDGVTGCLGDDLRDACLRAHGLDRAVVRQHALTRTWDAIATDLLNALVPLTPATRYNIAHA
ncbi:alpha-mannosyltransferase [Bordetella genomosp. 8]|uniref:Alpha-mannosyltransferase n=1 Tax=Bordetella genomosp. 8 TaxID=1416806 RepID=A0A1W6YSJ7_9BORD|nr:glycosyltransferase family 1 protein [Bordetella genomosp. 8]ARP84037.1 alpha-mannosyltransferase [Bordetella genomosp. 8]